MEETEEERYMRRLASHQELTRLLSEKKTSWYRKRIREIDALTSKWPVK